MKLLDGGKSRYALCSNIIDHESAVLRLMFLDNVLKDDELDAGDLEKVYHINEQARKVLVFCPELHEDVHDASTCQKED